MKKMVKAINLVTVAALVSSIPMCALAEEGKMTITFWHSWSGSEADALQAVIDDYNESQNEIYVEALSSQTEDKMLTAIPSGDGPDIIYTADTTCSKWAQAGMLADIDDYIVSSGMDTANFYESVYALGTYEGEQYGIPYTMDSYMLYYNQDVLDELGVEAPATLEEMAEISKKAVLTDENGDYTRLGYVPDYPWIDRVEIPYLFGADFYDFDTNQVTCTSDDFVAAINYKASFYNDYDREKVTKFKSGFGTYASSENALFQGKVVFSIEGEWFDNFIKEYAPADLNLGCVSVPVTETKTDIAGSGRLQGGMLSITSTSENVEAAFDVLNYLTSDDAYVKFCATKGSLPTTYSALSAETLIEQAPQLKGYVENVMEGNAKAFPAVPFSSEYSDYQGLEEEAVYSGDKTVEEALNTLYDEMQELADEWVAGK